MARLTLCLLGSVQVHLDGEPVTDFDSDKVRALLVYLAVESDRPHTREKLAGLLWPEGAESAARHNLSHALFNLRQAIGDREATPPFLLVARNRLQFNGPSDHWLDVAEFARLLDGCDRHDHVDLEACPACLERLQQAVGLYRGSFLDGFSLGDSSAFEEWFLLTRERLQRRVMEALQHLVAGHEQQGEHALALRGVWRQLELDPWREEAHRQVMRLLAIGGQRSAALEQYAACRRLLKEELGVEPAPETEELVVQIRSGVISSVQAMPPDNGAGVLSALPISLPPRYHLPESPTSLVGRRAELAAVQELICRRHVRLLTLTGPPGVGKTRLALTAAQRLVDDFRDGVCFVPLDLVQGADQVLAAVAWALGVPDTGGQALLDGLKLSLSGRKLLLLLDNCEHVIAAAPLISELLAASPGLAVLATSRELLRLQGETEYPVPPLATPDLDHLPAREALAQVESVQLFVQRSQAAVVTFALDDGNGPAVARICAELDGLPLAIELAAARVKLLPPQQILPLLADRFRLLRGGTRDAPDRHRALRRAIAWSYDLLDPEEQALFRRLAVFVGGWTLQAAEAVGHAGQARGPDVLEGLASLLDKSLVYTPDRKPTEARFGMLESIREYGLERLRESGGEADARRAHARYFLALAQEAELGLKGPGQMDLLARLEREHSNLLAALEWALQSGEAGIGLGLGAGLFYFWIRPAHYYREGLSLLEKLVAQADRQEHREAYAQVLYGAGMLNSILGDLPAARRFYEHSLQILRQLDCRHKMAYVLDILGSVERQEGNFQQADACLQEALGLYQEAGDAWAVAMSRSATAHLVTLWGDYKSARALCTEAITELRRLGDRWGLALSLWRLGDAFLCQGHHAEARTCYLESLVLAQELGTQQAIARATRGLGEIALAEGDLATARHYLQQSLTTFRRSGLRQEIAQTLAILACVWAAQNRPTRALRLAAAAEAQRAHDRPFLPPALQAWLDQTLEQTRQHLCEEAAVAWNEGQAMTLEQAIDYAQGSYPTKHTSPSKDR